MQSGWCSITFIERGVVPAVRKLHRLCMARAAGARATSLLLPFAADAANE